MPDLSDFRKVVEGSRAAVKREYFDIEENQKKVR
jgi:hypothetical protein